MVQTSVPSNSPYEQPTRRGLMAGLAATGVLGSASAMAAAPAVDPHVAWGEEWLRLRAWINDRTTHPGVKVEETAEWSRWIELEELIASTQAKTLKGMAAQAEVLAEGFPPCFVEEPDATYDAVHNLRRSLQQLAEGA